MNIIFRVRAQLSFPRRMLEDDVNRAARFLRRHAARFLPKTITIVLLMPRDARMANMKLRRRRSAPNVLSMNYGTEGEILLTPSTIRREAKLAGNEFSAQLRWMLAHGILHLAGVHHEAGGRAERNFDRLEGALLKQLGISVRRSLPSQPPSRHA